SCCGGVSSTRTSAPSTSIGATAPRSSTAWSGACKISAAPFKSRGTPHDPSQPGPGHGFLLALEEVDVPCQTPVPALPFASDSYCSCVTTRAPMQHLSVVHNAHDAAYP